ncbi:DNA mismatch repair protein MutS2 [Salsuginibacillus halophilus]|uniref:Endonuclease MutS2 n=1 Tax=Salsuginibacillus halophilus TaxID=517424 RepID=A0A2P8HCU9_9BACI|nr:endonuclease MutS2 [Salsuginibacillus halophilus]PSL44038.1 DNA mismatch repair protein MutS2 [Salsuginibacillus halophilus]
MNDRVLRLLEYDKMKDQMKQHVASSLGRSAVDELQPMTDYADIKAQLEESDEGAAVIRLKGQAPRGGIFDIRPQIKRAEIGGMLNESELIEISATIHAGYQLKTFIRSLIDDDLLQLPRLEAKVEDIHALQGLEQEIKQSIDDHGKVLDSASSDLRRIRQRLKTTESSIRSKLEQLTRSSDHQAKLSDAVVTIRNDRYVIPVKQEYRNAFGGIVHDQSSSGATLFIEPQSVVTLNNQLREAKADERDEIERILRELSTLVMNNTGGLLENVAILASLDFIFAKAYYAVSLKAERPTFVDQQMLEFSRARHPLIPQDEVVPIDVALGDEYQSLVITGPNTGGKTVTLKTVGLLTLMAQSGLFLPVASGSTAGIFQTVCADIGDEQSIEQNLSTFSSHMTNIVEMLDMINHESLVLFDELGAGTDPAEGAALAVAILDEVKSRGARTVATTHYSELKGYAYNREGVMNASVEFDVDTLQPTYRLLTGVPGRSNAFAISQRLGLDKDVINSAETHVSQETREVEQMITSLEEQKKLAEQDVLEAEEIRRDARQIHRELEKEFEAFQAEKEKELEKAREQAEAEVKKAKQDAEDIIEYLRELQREGLEVKEHELIDARKQLENAAPKTAKKQEKVKEKTRKQQAIELGDEVKVISFNQRGQVLAKVSDNEFQVQLGIMKMNVKKDDMEKIKSEPKQSPKPVARVQSNQHVKPELDLRGVRYDEAMHRVEKYLDEAVLAGFQKVDIIHGKGTGALRKGVKELLKKHPNVKNTRDGGMNEGGIGNTVVELK